MLLELKFSIRSGRDKSVVWVNAMADYSYLCGNSESSSVALRKLRRFLHRIVVIWDISSLTGLLEQKSFRT